MGSGTAAASSGLRMFINLLCLFLLARPCVVIIIFVVFAACGLVSVPELPAPTEPVTEASPCIRVHHPEPLAARVSLRSSRQESSDIIRASSAPGPSC